MPAEDALRLDDRHGRAPLAPDFGEPNPEEALTWAKFQSRMAMLVNGELLSDGEILQGEFATKFENGNE